MPYHILLVDDDKYFRLEFKELMADFDVIEAANGKDAIKILKKPNNIDLIILDEHLPGTRGTDLLDQMRSLCPITKIVILTGHSSKEVAIDAVRGHATDYLEKPLTKKKIGKIKTLLLSAVKGERDHNVGGIKGKIQQAKYFAQRNYNKKITLNDVAQEVCLSPKYLSRIFKEYTETSFSDYKIGIRINKAKELLKRTGENIEEIAFKLGYQNPKSFGKIFRQRTKLTPHEYREQDRKRTVKALSKEMVAKRKISPSSRSHRGRIILKSSQDAIVEQDINGNIISWSESAEKMYGWKESEMFKKKIFDTFPEHKREKFISIIGKLKAKEIVESFETQRIRKNGEIVDISMTFLPEIDEEGRLRRFITIEKDITNTKRQKQKLIEERDVSVKEKTEAQQVIGKKTKELIDTKKQLEKEKHLSDLGRMASILAHELRNPLNVVLAAVWNIKKKSKSNKYDDNLNSIEKMVTQQEGLINNLLNYSHIKLPVYQKTNIIQLINGGINLSKKRFGKRKVKIINDFTKIYRKNIETDPEQVKQILSNIIMNAYEALSDVKNKKIEIKGIEKRNFLNIEISDTGKGIPKENWGKVREPFFTTRPKGTGLGLAICQEIVNLHGGELDINSQLGKGTTVTIKLPLKKLK